MAPNLHTGPEALPATAESETHTDDWCIGITNAFAFRMVTTMLNGGAGVRSAVLFWFAC